MTRCTYWAVCAGVSLSMWIAGSVYGETLPALGGVVPEAIGAAPGRTTLLVPMKMDANNTWQEMAYLAAVPAGMQATNGAPSVLALPATGVMDQYILNYLDRYKPERILSTGPVPGYADVKQLAGTDLTQITCSLSGFWHKANTVVLAGANDYRSALVASNVAGRLRVPLFFFSKSGVDAAVMARMKSMGAKKVVIVGNAGRVAASLKKAGFTVDPIADALDAIPWFGENNIPINYFAVCNGLDRSRGFAPKASLAAALLASARGGAVVNIEYEVEFQNHYMLKKTQKRPKGAADSELCKGKGAHEWLVGPCKVNGKDYSVALSRPKWRNDLFFQGNIDLNHNGSFDDKGEFVKRGDVLQLGDKKYVIDFDGWKQFSDVRFTYPQAELVKADIQKYVDAMGHHPKYMAIVGLPDAVPPKVIIKENGRSVECFSDQFYADVDDDPMFDMAMGRIVGENVSIFTLVASRAITYEHLVDPAWRDRGVVYGHFNTPRTWRKAVLQSVGYSVDNIPRYQDVSRYRYGLIVHEDHGWAYAFEPASSGAIPPAFITTSGCSFGDMMCLKKSEYTYKNFACVQLMRTGAIGYYAFGKNATAGFNTMRDNLLDAVFYRGATLGEASLFAQNAGLLRFSADSENVRCPMLYADPAVRLALPERKSRTNPPKATLKGNTLRLTAPSEISSVETHGKDKSVYVPLAPGITQSKRYYASFTTSKPVTGMTQAAGIKRPLGWNGKWLVDKHWDGTRTVYLDVDFYEFDRTNRNVVKSSPEISFTLDE